MIFIQTGLRVIKSVICEITCVKQLSVFRQMVRSVALPVRDIREELEMCDGGILV